MNFTVIHQIAKAGKGAAYNEEDWMFTNTPFQSNRKKREGEKKAYWLKVSRVNETIGFGGIE